MRVYHPAALVRVNLFQVQAVANLLALVHQVLAKAYQAVHHQNRYLLQAPQRVSVHRVARRVYLSVAVLVAKAYHLVALANLRLLVAAVPQKVKVVPVHQSLFQAVHQASLFHLALVVNL